MSALVEKKTGLEGSRTLIQGGFCAWWSDGSIFAQDITPKLFAGGVKSNRPAAAPRSRYSFVRPESA